jgi:hypothetical protein
MRRLCSDATLEKRLMAKVTKPGASEDDCWGWNGATYAFGYGTIGTSKGNDGAHRVSYRLFVGEIPEGLCVLHKCDNPKCTNPKHLFLGSKQDNAVDRNLKGRGKNNVLRGENSHYAKLTEAQAREIKASSEPHAVLAAKFGLAKNSVGRIKRGERWKHIG